MCVAALFFIYHFEEFFTVSRLLVEYMAHFFRRGSVCVVDPCCFLKMAERSRVFLDMF